MKTVLFSKAFNSKSPEELVEIASLAGADGYDLCIRDGHQINPANVSTRLKSLVAFLRKNGLDVPMASGEGHLLYPEDPTARPILAALSDSGVGNLKIGYFVYDPHKDNYQEYVDKIMRAFDGWEKLGREYGVKICYHTHSGPCMGLNGSALVNLLKDFDPKHVGAYIDPAHLVVNGEDFDCALGMLEKHVGLVALKDVMMIRQEKNGHGSVKLEWVRAGHGMVDWTLVFSELLRIGYDGILSVHCEFEVPEREFIGTTAEEVAFFRKFLN